MNPLDNKKRNGLNCFLTFYHKLIPSLNFYSFARKQKICNFYYGKFFSLDKTVNTQEWVKEKDTSMAGEKESGEVYGLYVQKPAWQKICTIIVKSVYFLENRFFPCI